VTTPADSGLLGAIIDAPADDAPRLQLADWLREHGDEARADFIEVQCELSRLAPCEYEFAGGFAINCQCRTCALRARERELWGYVGEANHQNGIRRQFFEAMPGWAVLSCGDDGRGLSHDYPWATVRRGFVDSLTLDTATFMRPGLAAAVFAAMPVTTVRLVGAEPYQVMPGVFDWYDAKYSEGDGSPADVPSVIFEQIGAKESGPWSRYYRTFDTSQAALDALSAAACTWAREQAEALCLT